MVCTCAGQDITKKEILQAIKTTNESLSMSDDCLESLDSRLKAVEDQRKQITSSAQKVQQRKLKEKYLLVLG